MKKLLYLIPLLILNFISDCSENDNKNSVRSNLSLGSDYYYGINGVEKDYKIATKYLNQVVSDPSSTIAQIGSAHFFLGIMNFKGEYGIEKNYKIAVEQLNQFLNNQGENENLRTEVHLGLGAIYFYGGYGISQNLTIASENFLIVANNENAPEQARHSALSVLVRINQLRDQTISNFMNLG
jgi:TPR repeat protein